MSILSRFGRITFGYFNSTASHFFQRPGKQLGRDSLPPICAWNKKTGDRPNALRIAASQRGGAIEPREGMTRPKGAPADRDTFIVREHPANRPVANPLAQPGSGFCSLNLRPPFSFFNPPCLAPAPAARPVSPEKLLEVGKQARG